MVDQNKRHPSSKEAKHKDENPVETTAGEPLEGYAEEGVDVAALRAELEAAQAKTAEYFDGWQRERADFANYKRRVEREQASLRDNLTWSIIKKYLVVLDDLERALKNRPAAAEDAAWAGGIELIYRKLQTLLENEGVQRMAAEGEEFDPNRHEAISHEDSPDHESGEIIEVVQPGYLIGERVLRPALVRVAR